MKRTFPTKTTTTTATNTVAIQTQFQLSKGQQAIHDVLTLEGVHTALRTKGHFHNQSRVMLWMKEQIKQCPSPISPLMVAVLRDYAYSALPPTLTPATPRKIDEAFLRVGYLPLSPPSQVGSPN